VQELAGRAGPRITRSVRVASGQRVLAFHLDRDDPELKVLRDPARLLAKARHQALLAGVERGSAAVRVHAQPAGGASAAARSVEIEWICSSHHEPHMPESGSCLRGGDHGHPRRGTALVAGSGVPVAEA
jgi:hypothetical protein